MDQEIFRIVVSIGLAAMVSFMGFAAWVARGFIGDTKDRNLKVDLHEQRISIIEGEMSVLKELRDELIRMNERMRNLVNENKIIEKFVMLQTNKGHKDHD